jgi:hypothetical protein
MACAAIILDAAETTRLNDDRPDIDGQVAELLSRHAEARKAKRTYNLLHADAKPEPENMGPTVGDRLLDKLQRDALASLARKPAPEPEPIDLPDFRKGLRDLAAREAGVSVGELNMFGRKADNANNDDLKHWSRENQPLPRAPLMRQGLRIKGSELWFEDTVIVPDLDRVLIPSDVGRLIDLVDGIDGEPRPARWADVHDPEG